MENTFYKEIKNFCKGGHVQIINYGNPMFNKIYECANESSFGDLATLSMRLWEDCRVNVSYNDTDNCYVIY